jgi:hypothetical protein
LLVSAELSYNSVNVLASRITNPAFPVAVCEVHRHFLFVVIAVRTMIQMFVALLIVTPKNLGYNFSFVLDHNVLL